MIQTRLIIQTQKTHDIGLCKFNAQVSLALVGLQLGVKLVKHMSQSCHTPCGWKRGRQEQKPDLKT